MATISEPLRRLTKKRVSFNFGLEQKKAFQELKDKLSSATTLGYFDKDAPTQVVADARPVGLGAVLTQTQKDGQRVIGYASRSLSETERKYSQTKKEALVLVCACENFHTYRYVYGISFELITDHKPLEVIYGPKSKRARIERWVLQMQPYKFKVKCAQGLQNIADSLSRLVRDWVLQPNRQRLSGILVVIDYYSRYYEIEVMKSTTTSKVIERLVEIFSRHGLPESLTSDNGPQFISSEFKVYMDYQRNSAP